jgi:hypothetical protein
MNSLDIERYNSSIQFYFNYADFFLSWISTLLVVRKSWQRSLHKYCVTNGLTVVIYHQQLGNKERQLIIEHSRESRKAGQSTRKYY